MNSVDSLYTTTQICKDCNRRTQFVNTGEFEVCPECGVCQIEVFDLGPEFRVFADDPEGGEERNHYGYAMEPDANLTTIISSGSAQWRLQKLHNYTSETHSQRVLGDETERLRDLASSLALSKLCAMEAELLFKEVRNQRRRDYRNTESIMLASLYIVAKRVNEGRTQREILASSRSNKTTAKQFSAALRFVQRCMLDLEQERAAAAAAATTTTTPATTTTTTTTGNSSTTTATIVPQLNLIKSEFSGNDEQSNNRHFTSNFTRRVCCSFNLGGQFTEKCAKKSEELYGVFPSRTPSTLAAAAIYLELCAEQAQKRYTRAGEAVVDLEAVAEACDCAPASVKNCVVEYERYCYYNAHNSRPVKVEVNPGRPTVAIPTAMLSASSSAAAAPAEPKGAFDDLPEDFDDSIINILVPETPTPPTTTAVAYTAAVSSSTAAQK